MVDILTVRKIENMIEDPEYSGWFNNLQAEIARRKALI